jgi:hypothetical protein
MKLRKDKMIITELEKKQIRAGHPELFADGWMFISDYRKRMGISRQWVHKLILQNKMETKSVMGFQRRYTLIKPRRLYTGN